jgi:hypothetical protein
MRLPAHASTRGAGGRDRWLRWGVALGVLLLALGVHHVRRGFIRAFFGDGGAGAAPSLTTGPASRDVDATSRLRIVLVDGLGADHAQTLPHLDRLCRGGLDLRVDTGFPTVSLPVQHALWTGLTQTQTGVMYRIAPLSEPPDASIPARVAGSIAVAESYPEIVHSFGFSRARPSATPMEASAAEAWRTEGFAVAAREAVTSSARLVFIHVLRVDEAGHAHGAASEAYARAADWADAFLDELVRADADAEPHTRWIVLSDHGHRPAGGHGGSEPSIRIVRACVFGHRLPVPVEPTSHALHLVDLSRLVADSLELRPHPESAGRPLETALARPDPGATLPRPGLLRWGVAAVLLLSGIAATGWAARRRWSRLPWWLVVAYLGVVAIHGFPTLSHPMVYPPMGRDMMLGALPGLFVLTWSDLRGYADAPILDRVVGHTALVVALALAASTLCGELGRLVGLTPGPPLMPIWTAQASVLLTFTVVGAGGLAVLLLVRRG